MPSVPRPAPHGWLILDKPRGLGSTQAVGAVKRILRENGWAKPKIGHGGTLDPLAEGVLPIALGEATKLAGRMLEASKVYEFTIRFGEETDTLDAEGETIERSDARPSQSAIEAVLPRFTGPIEQTPPAYSAIKVDGRRAYALARAGEAVALASRAVTVHALALLCADGETAALRAEVSKGTYVRSLARDIARAAGTVGHVTRLRRIRAGPFDEGRAISLDFLAEHARGNELAEVILPVEAGLDGIPALSLTPEQVSAVRQGRVPHGLAAPEGLSFATGDGSLVALLETTEGRARIARGFNPPDAAE